MDELEVKAQTRLTGRSHAIGASQPSTCTVDECMHKAAARYEVTVTNDQLAPESETHSVPLCETHANAGDALKWEWRRTKDAPSGQRLKLDALFAVDTIEDRQHP
jgi:hypothetical protein